MSHKLFPFLMAGLFLLAGCAPNTDVTQPDRPPVSDSSGSLSGNDAPQEALPDDTQIYDYTVAASLDMVTRGSGNESGFYQVIPNENGYANLFIRITQPQAGCICAVRQTARTIQPHAPLT